MNPGPPGILLQLCNRELLLYAKLARIFSFSDLSRVVAFGYNKLWRALVANCLSKPSQMLWPLTKRTVKAIGCKTNLFMKFGGTLDIILYAQT